MNICGPHAIYVKTSYMGTIYIWGICICLINKRDLYIGDIDIYIYIGIYIYIYVA